ncbi:hypothetical protein JCM11251_001474 [Rhodosporidiobolus azoricus]
METLDPTPVLVSLFHPFPRTLSLSLSPSTPVSSLPALLSPYCPPALQSISYSTGRSLPSPTSSVASLTGSSKDEGGFVSLRLAVKTLGGKGGFASQLRAQGGRMSSNKAQNTDSCRGLDGRRLSTMKEAQKMAKLLESEPDRLALAAQQKQQKLDELNAEIQRLERAAGVEPSTSISAAGPSASGSGSGIGGKKEEKVTGNGQGGVKRRLDDQKYVEESRAINSNVKDAVKAAMLKKRKKNKPSPPATDENAAPSTTAATPTDVKGKGKAKAADPEEEVEEKQEEKTVA